MNYWKIETLPFPNLVKGGTGCKEDDDRFCELIDEIEHIKPDYSLYPEIDYSLGFSSRGCLRKCGWCVVPKKEGMVHAHAEIYEFLDRQFENIVLMDNNLLASSNWKKTLEDIIKEKLKADFNQALDIRLVNEENARLLKQVRYMKQLRFSLDTIKYEEKFLKSIDILKKAEIPMRSILVYCLCGWDEGWKADIHRLKLVSDLLCDPYVMIYQDLTTGEQKRYAWEDCPQEIKDWLKEHFRMTQPDSVLGTVMVMFNGFLFREVKNEFLKFVEKFL
jgi:hypothetical protein